MPESSAPESAGERSSTASMQSRACLRCIAKKQKCGHERPSCRTCIEAREECSYPPAQSRRGPVAGLAKVAEQRVQQCESALAFLLSLPGVALALDELILEGNKAFPSIEAAPKDKAERATWWHDNPIRRPSHLRDFAVHCTALRAAQASGSTDAAASLPRPEPPSTSTGPHRPSVLDPPSRARITTGAGPSGSTVIPLVSVSEPLTFSADLTPMRPPLISSPSSTSSHLPRGSLDSLFSSFDANPGPPLPPGRAAFADFGLPPNNTASSLRTAAQAQDVLPGRFMNPSGPAPEAFKPPPDKGLYW